MPHVLEDQHPYDPVEDLAKTVEAKPSAPAALASGVPAAPKPVFLAEPGSMASVVDKTFPELGLPLAWAPAPRPTPKAPAPVQATDAKPAPKDTPPMSTVTEIFNGINAVVLSQTHLSEKEAELVTFWIISTWVQSSLSVLPCLVITGSSSDAYRILYILRALCCVAALVPGFGRSHLEALRCCWTALITEPKLTERTANLISSLTDPRFMVVTGSDLRGHAKSIAIYAGESPEIPQIQNALRVHLAPTKRESTAQSQGLQTTTEDVRVHLNNYREKSLHQIKHSAWVPSGLSSEAAAVATALGRAIVGAPELQQKLVTLLKIEDDQRLSDMSNTREALALEAILSLLHQDKLQFRAGEIADEVNRIAKERGERIIQSAENIGHALKKVGLVTRRLGKAGKGLIMDTATAKRVHELAAVYGGAGLDSDDQNLHCPFCSENKELM